MLMIRAEQLSAFVRDAESRFAPKVVQMLYEEWLDLVVDLSETEVQSLVRAALSRAREYGMSTANVLETFTILTFGYGPGFERHPEVARVLGDTTIHPDERIDALFTDLPDQCWDELDILAWSWDA